jgi:lantibiotic modifying enzyme
MPDTMTVKLDEIKQIYELVERLNEFFHDPYNHPNIEKFATEIYPDIRNAYYHTIRDWLPPEVQQFYEER